MIPYNKSLVTNAQELRKNMTPEEKQLWYDFLKLLPYTVKRQHNIDNFIVDFYIPKKKIVIEIDGIQHNTIEHKRADIKRDNVLHEWGISVLRYSNKSINTNFVAVAKDILAHIGLDFSDLKVK
jgi:very-short-patch-repair endonuclease